MRAPGFRALFFSAKQAKPQLSKVSAHPTSSVMLTQEIAYVLMRLLLGKRGLRLFLGSVTAHKVLSRWKKAVCQRLDFVFGRRTVDRDGWIRVRAVGVPGGSL